jgi:hypothetical protein
VLIPLYNTRVHLLSHIPPRSECSGANILLIERSSLILVLSALSTVQVTCCFAWAYWDLVFNFGNSPELIIIPPCVSNLFYLCRPIHASFVFTLRRPRTGDVSISTPLNTIVLLTSCFYRRNCFQLYACLEIIEIAHSHASIVSHSLFGSNVCRSLLRAFTY